MHLEVQSLSCKYGSKTVLNASNLKFEEGKVYFLLGKSGAGKSTFLEAMGLMTDTMSVDSRVYLHQSEEKSDLKKLWKLGDESISRFRSDNYSFIFQSTNLMNNFSAGENMCLTLMLAGMSFEEAKSKVLQIMEKVELDEEVFGKGNMNLSGGQRQRLAFVRAISAPHHVLYCDEPTGNLDEVIAHKLMTLLKQEVQNTNKIAIVVSHSIPLSLQFADQIFCAKLVDGIGVINEADSLLKHNNTWTMSNGDALNDPSGYLINTIT